MVDQGFRTSGTSCISESTETYVCLSQSGSDSGVGIEICICVNGDIMVVGVCVA